MRWIHLNRVFERQSCTLSMSCLHLSDIWLTLTFFFQREGPHARAHQSIWVKSCSTIRPAVDHHSRWSRRERNHRNPNVREFHLSCRSKPHSLIDGNMVHTKPTSTRPVILSSKHIWAGRKTSVSLWSSTPRAASVSTPFSLNASQSM